MGQTVASDQHHCPQQGDKLHRAHYFCSYLRIFMLDSEDVHVYPFQAKLRFGTFFRVLGGGTRSEFTLRSQQGISTFYGARLKFICAVSRRPLHHVRDGDFEVKLALRFF